MCQLSLSVCYSEGGFLSERFCLCAFVCIVCTVVVCIIMCVCVFYVLGVFCLGVCLHACV